MPTIIYDWDPRNLPPDYLRAIGLVTTCWASTDATVQEFIGACLGVDVVYSTAVTAHMAVPLRDGIARAIAEIRISDLDALDALDEILDGINTAADKRNAYAHHGWCIHPDTKQVFTAKITARGSVRSQLIPVSVDDIKSDAQFIYEAGNALVEFMAATGIMPLFPANPVDRSGRTRAGRKARRKNFAKE